MKNIGLLFGSFNPIHNGHLMVANFCLETNGFDEIYFVVAKQNPFKTQQNMLPFDDRLNLCAAAIEGYPKMKVCPIENELTAPYYTINTLELLKYNNPNDHFTIIIGIDNWLSFEKWKDSKKLFENDILVLPRGNKDDFNTFVTHKNQICETNEFHNERLKIFTNVKFAKECISCNMSSTLIRTFIQNQKNISFFVPKQVEELIKLKKYYG